MPRCALGDSGSFRRATTAAAAAALAASSGGLKPPSNPRQSPVGPRRRDRRGRPSPGPCPSPSPPPCARPNPHGQRRPCLSLPVACSRPLIDRHSLLFWRRASPFPSVPNTQHVPTWTLDPGHWPPSTTHWAHAQRGARGHARPPRAALQPSLSRPPAPPPCRPQGCRRGAVEWPSQLTQPHLCPRPQGVPQFISPCPSPLLPSGCPLAAPTPRTGAPPQNPHPSLKHSQPISRPSPRNPHTPSLAPAPVPLHPSRTHEGAPAGRGASRTPSHPDTATASPADAPLRRLPLRSLRPPVPGVKA